MPLIGLLTATEKQVHLGQLHMRLIQWHHKHNWRVPRSSENMPKLRLPVRPHGWLGQGQKISLVSWIVSTETDPKAGGAYPPGTSHWFCTN